MPGEKTAAWSLTLFILKWTLGLHLYSFVSTFLTFSFRKLVATDCSLGVHTAAFWEVWPYIFLWLLNWLCSIWSPLCNAICVAGSIFNCSPCRISEHFPKTMYKCHLLSTVWGLLLLSKYFTHSIKPTFRACRGWVSVRVQELKRGGNTREYKTYCNKIWTNGLLTARNSPQEQGVWWNLVIKEQLTCIHWRFEL